MLFSALILIVTANDSDFTNGTAVSEQIAKASAMTSTVVTETNYYKPRTNNYTSKRPDHKTKKQKKKQRKNKKRNRSHGLPKNGPQKGSIAPSFFPTRAYEQFYTLMEYPTFLQPTSQLSRPNPRRGQNNKVFQNNKRTSNFQQDQR